MKFKKILTVGIPAGSLDKQYWQKLDALAEQRISLEKDNKEVRAQLKETDCLLINPFVLRVDGEIIAAAPQLKFISTITTAYGTIDLSAAKQKGIVVTNIPGYSTEAVAEFVLAIILEHLRCLERGKSQARAGNFSEIGFSATEIKGKIFGIIGLGAIGRRVVELIKGFGAEVKYWSRHRKPDAETQGIEYEEIDQLIPQCDFLSLHLAQTPATENFLNSQRIQKIKKGAVVINTAPLELVETPALITRLKKKELTYIFDHSDELDNQHFIQLKKCPNCVIYPPIGYVTKEARVAKQEIFVNNIASFLNGSPINKVN